MSQEVQIVIPEHCLDDDRYGKAIDYDQRIGRLAYSQGTLVKIDGELINFPRAWIKPAPHRT